MQHPRHFVGATSWSPCSDSEGFSDNVDFVDFVKQGKQNRFRFFVGVAGGVGGGVSRASARLRLRSVSVFAGTVTILRSPDLNTIVAEKLSGRSSCGDTV